jgi:type IV pilus assembly protein PilB
MEETELIPCPTCGHPLKRGDFLCVRCETIVDSSALVEDPEPPREPTVIRALLSPPEPTLIRAVSKPPPPPPDSGPKGDRRSVTKTRLFTLPAAPDDVPTVELGLDLRSCSLSSFEAYFLSLIDGRSEVEQLRMVAALSKIEVQSILRSLLDRGLVKLHPAPEPPKKPRTPEPRPRPAERSAQPEPKAAPAPAPSAPRPMPKPQAARVAAPRPPPTARRSAAPPCFGSPLQRAIALERDGDYKGAIAVLEQAIAHSSSPAPLFNRLAIAVVKERRDLPAAEELLQKALELEPDNEVYRQNLLKILSMEAALTGKHRLPRRPAR